MKKKKQDYYRITKKLKKNYRCIIKVEKKKCKIKKKNECDKKAVIVTKEQTLRKE